MQRVVILGAGFGGLELATTLSDAVGADIDVVLIDKNDSFLFGYSKLDVLFGLAGGDHRRRCPRGRRAGRPARRRLRHGCDARAGRGRQRVLLGRRGRASCPGAAHFLARARHHRRLRCAVQVPAGSERGSAAAARLPGDARNPRRLPALDRDPIRGAGYPRRRTRRRRWWRPSATATSSSCPVAGWLRSTPAAALPYLTTGPRCRSTSSSGFPATGPRMS
jgi:hypothetical protein